MTNKVLVLGVGNLLMGDEGVGVHAAQMLERDELPEDVDVLDGGTGGFHLLSVFEDYDPIIIIDATMDGKSPGTVTLMRPRFASDFPRTLSAHDIGLRDLIECAQLVGPMPELFLVTISIESIQSATTELSEEVKGSLGEVMGAVKNILGTLSTKLKPSVYSGEIRQPVSSY